MFSGVRDEQQFHALMQQWNDTDKKRWVAAKMRLWDGIMADTVPAFNEVAELIGISGSTMISTALQPSSFDFGGAT